MKHSSARESREEVRRWIDLVYPPRCAVCERFLQPGEARGICPGCRDGLKEAGPPLCPCCGVPFEAGTGENRLCERCLRERPAYEAARSLFVYEGAALEAVHRFKYGGKTRLAKIFGPRLAGLARTWLPPDVQPLVVPVPLHLRRLRERGFNQSLLLARHVAAQPGCALDFLALRRNRYTPPQAALGRDERRGNVQAAFEVETPAAVQDRDILLVDDVSTTGSTLDACSRALLRAGARRIFGLTLARAPAP
ncbi:MAG: ComF family protein [Deltaproteobacteria bacterium]|nr:ComF family protein [Deltaproteobacteria bacterium]